MSARYKYRITIADNLGFGKSYEGWYHDATDAVSGAMSTDRTKSDHSGTMYILVTKLTQKTTHRSTPGLKKL